jgi:hypothetical protein
MEVENDKVRQNDRAASTPRVKDEIETLLFIPMIIVFQRKRGECGGSLVSIREDRGLASVCVYKIMR